MDQVATELDAYALRNCAENLSVPSALEHIRGQALADLFASYEEIGRILSQKGMLCAGRGRTFR